MCILFIAINQHPKYPWVIAANRDEFHQRPTQALHFWPSQKFYAGKDLQAGGTWLGVNEAGDFAALTNIRTMEYQREDAQSRGELVTLALQKDSPINLAWLQDHGRNYNPFNLLYSRNNALYCYNSLQQTHNKLTTGFHAICNGAIDDVWPKMARGEQQLEQLVNKHQPIEMHELKAMMLDTEQAPNELLPDTGVGLRLEKFLSSIFIKGEEYGTRATSLLLYQLEKEKQGKQGQIDFYEQSYLADGKPAGTEHLTINI